MHSFNFIVTLLFALIGCTAAFPQFHFFEARADGGKNGTARAKNGTRGNSVDKQCKSMAKLTILSELANNQTKIDALVAKGKLSDTQVTELKSQAANATTKLQAMSANATLVGECAAISAHKKTLGQCKEMKSLTKLAALASNQTAMDAMMAKKKLNETQVTMLQDKIKSAQTKLDALKGNTTLADICSKETSQKGNSGSNSGSAGASAGTGTTAAATKSSSSRSATLESMSFVFLPALLAVFALFV